MTTDGLIWATGLFIMGVFLFCLYELALWAWAWFCDDEEGKL